MGEKESKEMSDKCDDWDFKHPAPKITHRMTAIDTDELARLRAEVTRLTEEREQFERHIKKEACRIANEVIALDAEKTSALEARSQSAEAALAELRAAVKDCLDYAEMDAWLDSPNNPNDAWGIRKSQLQTLRALIEKENGDD
jgi:seryl-tRNA synthetase